MTTTRLDAYATKARLTRQRRDAADKKFSAEFALRQQEAAAKRDAMVEAKRAQATVSELTLAQ